MSATAVALDRRGSGRVSRLLSGIDANHPVSLGDHLARFGPIGAVAEKRGARLLDIVEASGLRGRGGSSFPTATKLRAVAARRGRPVVVVNATEGEPVSGKDKMLLRHVPHLVLDGAVAAAAALGAREAIVAVSQDAVREHAILVAAIAARKAAEDGRVSLRVAVVPSGFVSGEETALVSFLNGGPARPTFRPPLPFERGVGGAPTLVQNTETLAHLALIARFGPQWFREVGTALEPGTALVTLSGAVREPGVYEVEIGTPLHEVVARAGGLSEPVKAFLVGGYFGTWIPAGGADLLTLDNASLRGAGAALGAGAIVALPVSACGVTETARVARYLAGESAGQCGPCVYGLDAIAGGLERIAQLGRADERQRILRWLRQVEGRGACRHPDGAVRFVGSALTVFADEFERPLRAGRRSQTVAPVLPVPRRA